MTGSVCRARDNFGLPIAQRCIAYAMLSHVKHLWFVSVRSKTLIEILRYAQDDNDGRMRMVDAVILSSSGVEIESAFCELVTNTVLGTRHSAGCLTSPLLQRGED